MREKIVSEDSVTVEKGICGDVIKLINPDNSGAQTLSCVIVTLRPSAESETHYHKRREEIYYVLEGEGLLIVDSNKYDITKGMTAFIPPGTSHKVINKGTKPLRLFVVGSPPYSPADTFKISSEQI